MTDLTLPQDFRALSAMLGSNPLQVQGPGGNTSLKKQGSCLAELSQERHKALYGNENPILEKFETF